MTDASLILESDPLLSRRVKELDPLLPESVEEVLASSKLFTQFASTPPLTSVLQSIPISDDVLKTIANAIKKLGDVRLLLFIGFIKRGLASYLSSGPSTSKSCSVRTPDTLQSKI